MTKKSKIKFYDKAWGLLRKDAPPEEVYLLSEDYDISPQEIKEYLDKRVKRNAISQALVPVSTEQQKAKYQMLDSSFINSQSNIVVFQRGENAFFYRYENGVYKHLSKFEMENGVDLFMETSGLLDHRTSRSRVKDTVARIASILSRTPGRHFSDDNVIHRKYKLNLRNGLLDIETLKLEPHTPEYFTTVQLPYDYDPMAVSPEFEKFVQTVSNGDQTTALMIQEMYGYCLSEGNPKHKVFYLYGETARNGKSTTAKILCGLIGSENYSTLSLEQMSKESSPALLQLVGKQLNYSDEISTKYIESSMLTSLSAEGWFEVNPKYKDTFKYQAKNKFIITCNDLPKFQNGQGMIHRMITIPFEFQIPEKDRIDRLDEILLEKEGSGILNWAISGLRMLKDSKVFSINKKSQEDRLENIKESNSVYAFLYDTFEFDSNYEEHFDKKNSLYDLYQTYCRETRLMPKGYQSFCGELRRFANETKKITYHESNGARYYQGLQLSYDKF